MMPGQRTAAKCGPMRLGRIHSNGTASTAIGQGIQNGRTGWTASVAGQCSGSASVLSTTGSIIVLPPSQGRRGCPVESAARPVRGAIPVVTAESVAARLEYPVGVPLASVMPAVSAAIIFRVTAHRVQHVTLLLVEPIPQRLAGLVHGSVGKADSISGTNCARSRGTEHVSCGSIPRREW